MQVIGKNLRRRRPLRWFVAHGNPLKPPAIYLYLILASEINPSRRFTQCKCGMARKSGP